jgi:hypothetical protein
LINQRVDYGEVAGISGGFRTDYSSAFGAASTPFTFPRGDGYVRLSAFDFWKDSKIASTVEEFKLRAAYGEAGIQPNQFDRYVTLNTKTIGTSNSFYFPLSQSNPGLNVEVSKELEIGTDMVWLWLKVLLGSMTCLSTLVTGKEVLTMRFTTLMLLHRQGLVL